MDVYATQFLKTIIKILQQNRQYIKLDQVKSIVEKIMYVEPKLDVMANSWPLYLVISMFLNSYFTDNEGKYYPIKKFNFRQRKILFHHCTQLL
jgi:hypothetical protein